jgi:hypothetical protein
LALRLAGVIPGVPRQRAGVLTLIADAHSGTQTSRRLLSSIDSLTDRTVFDRGVIPLDGLAELEAAVRQAGTELSTMSRSSAGLWSSLADARQRLDQITAETSRSLLDGADAIGAARTFMGADRPRRYLVAVQNNAEMRDQGMVLSYAVVRFDQQRMTVEKSGPITDFNLQHEVDISLPRTTEQVFGALQPKRLWQSMNATADWPLSAETMVAMYHQATGESVDGVIALDVPGLAAMLRVIGPVPNPAGGASITADTVGRVLLHDFYDQVQRGEQGLRKERLAEVAATIIARLTTGAHDAIGLGRELGAAAAGSHFRLWSMEEPEERVFRRTGLGGGPAEHQPDRTLHLSVQNGTATKLDYYIRQRVRLDVYLTEVGTAVVRTTVTVQNTAPADAQPSYQLGPDNIQQAVGQYIGRVYYWGPRDASQLGHVEESGLSLSYNTLTLSAGQSGDLHFESVIPKAVRDGTLSLRLVPQPTLIPAALEVRLHAEGWSVRGDKAIDRAWDRTSTVAWTVTR